MDSITSNIVNDSEQETTTLDVAVSASEEGGVSDLAVCPLCNRGFLLSKGCNHHAQREKRPRGIKYNIKLVVSLRLCIFCNSNLRGRDKKLCAKCRKLPFVIKHKRSHGNYSKLLADIVKYR